VFRPRALVGGEFDFDIGSAGSSALVIQTVALPLALASESSRVRLRGGTHAIAAPIHEFLARAWLPLVRHAGADLTLAIRQAGFYPVGGGEVVLETLPSGRLLPIQLAPSSGDLELHLEAISSALPEHIAERELASATELLSAEVTSTRARKVRSPGPGNAMWLVADDRVTGIGNLFSAIGERGRPAEEIGREAAQAYLAWRESGASVEPHLADQLMVPIAIAGAGSYTSSELTLHSRTNIEVIAAFTGRRLRVFELAPDRYRITLDAR
jgi:RNA 3'-terminal phosphate cyclase (ATP)